MAAKIQTYSAPESSSVDPSQRTFGKEQFSDEERDQIQRRLKLCLGPEFVSTRSGGAGPKVNYLEGTRAIELANDTFGFAGWSTIVKLQRVDYVGGATFFHFCPRF